METPTTDSAVASQGTTQDTTTNTQVASPNDAPATPSVMDLTDDSLVRYPGAKEPVKFKDIRNFQAQWTRESQRRAQLEQRLQQREAQIQAFERERQAQAQRQSQGGSNGAQSDVFEALRALPYLSGQDAVEVVQGIQNEIRYRDQVQLATLKKLAEFQKRLDSIYETHTDTAFEAKIGKFLSDGGHDPGWAELAKEVYLAYTGDDLDLEFPRILADRISTAERIFEARRAAKLREAKPQPFVPGRGGQAGPSKPLQLDPKASSSQIAEDLWASLQASGE